MDSIQLDAKQFQERALYTSDAGELYEHDWRKDHMHPLSVTGKKIEPQLTKPPTYYQIVEAEGQLTRISEYYILYKYCERLEERLHDGNL